MSRTVVVELRSSRTGRKRAVIRNILVSTKQDHQQERQQNARLVQKTFSSSENLEKKS
jgi:hypothetical protein